MATLHAALVTPLTGPLGLYGKAGATALTLWAKKAAHLPAHFTSTTGFGRDVAEGATRAASRLQMTLHAVLFDPSHVLETIAEVPESDILLVAGNFADEAAAAPVFVSGNWRFIACVGADLARGDSDLDKRVHRSSCRPGDGHGVGFPSD